MNVFLLLIIMIILLFIIDFENSYDSLINWYIPLFGIFFIGSMIYWWTDSLKKKLKMDVNPLIVILFLLFLLSPLIFLLYNAVELIEELGLFSYIIVFIINIGVILIVSKR